MIETLKENYLIQKTYLWIFIMSRFGDNGSSSFVSFSNTDQTTNTTQVHRSENTRSFLSMSAGKYSECEQQETQTGITLFLFSTINVRGWFTWMDCPLWGSGIAMQLITLLVGNFHIFELRKVWLGAGYVPTRNAWSSSFYQVIHANIKFNKLT